MDIVDIIDIVDIVDKYTYFTYFHIIDIVIMPQFRYLAPTLFLARLAPPLCAPHSISRLIISLLP